jgi:hypothetical protein
MHLHIDKFITRHLHWLETQRQAKQEMKDIEFAASSPATWLSQQNYKRQALRRV